MLPEDEEEDWPPGEGMDEPPCDPPCDPPEGMLEELPPDRPDDPPELPELPPELPEEGGELEGIELEDCCSGQPPMRNTAAAPTATSLPRESRRLRR